MKFKSPPKKKKKKKKKQVAVVDPLTFKRKSFNLKPYQLLQHQHFDTFGIEYSILVVGRNSTEPRQPKKDLHQRPSERRSELRLLSIPTFEPACRVGCLGD